MTTTSEGDALRARSWSEFIGQSDIRHRLSVHIQAASAEGRMLDHVLLAGPPGFGKTTLAGIIADSMEDFIYSVTMPVDLTPILRQWEGGILFLDEIHRASTSQQEELLPLLEDGYLQLRTGRRLHVPHLTVIGATTEPDKIIPPLYDRFPIKPMFADYSDDEMGAIVQSMADRAGLLVDPEFCIQLGRATGGTPRNARRLIFAIRDIQAQGDEATLENVLSLCGVEPDGLTQEHLKYLDLLIGQTQAGLSTLSTLMRLHPSTVQSIERLLVERHLIEFTPKGRILTPAGYNRRQQQNRPRMRRNVA